ncbi:PGPGW domain-containing protein [Nocardioides sp. MH1]|uniref:PGPGW domain-containing protein n=1 Tax=Nocardioides sp. MH1 TaxID=3242490 RepID=UPI00351FA1E8
MTGAAKRHLIGAAGFLIVVVGIAAIPLPGPGWMLLYAGVKVLSTQYEWAERFLDPVELRALRGAAQAVQTPARVAASTVFALAIGAFGVLWIVGPGAPSWWPMDDRWWLAGGTWTGVTMLVSCVLALALLVYSFRRFYGKPDAVEALSKQLDEADEDLKESLHRDHG